MFFILLFINDNMSVGNPHTISFFRHPHSMANSTKYFETFQLNDVDCLSRYNIFSEIKSFWNNSDPILALFKDRANQAVH